MGETLVTQLTILGTNIRQDENGRYSLGDCWQLSGKDPKNKPSEWYSATKTQDFLVVLGGERGSPLTSEGETENSLTLGGEPENGITPVSVVKTGPNEGRGYWANREAVIHYATWINPEFYLKVIRAFDEAERSKFNLAPKAIDLNDPAFLRQTLLGYTEKVIALEAEKAILAPKAEGFDRFANSTGRTILREVGKALHIGSKRGIELLREKKWTFRAANGKWHAYSAKVDAGLLDVKYVTYTNSAGEEISTQQVYVTPKGMARLALEMGQN